jgi:hypothetical protein
MNLKITSKEDLKLAEAVLKSQAKRNRPAIHPFADEECGAAGQRERANRFFSDFRGLRPVSLMG